MTKIRTHAFQFCFHDGVSQTDVFGCNKKVKAAKMPQITKWHLTIEASAAFTKDIGRLETSFDGAASF